MFTSTQLIELEKLYNHYSYWLEAYKGEEERNNDRMIAFSRVMEILGYEVELEGETVSYEWASYGVKYNTYRLVRKKDSQNNEVKDMTLSINDIISALEKERNNIEQNIDDEDKDINYMKLARYDELDEQINSLHVCVEYIKNAMGRLVLYTD